MDNDYARAAVVRRTLKQKHKLGTRIAEDDPRWNPKTMGNKRGRRPKPTPVILPNRGNTWS